MRSTTKAKLSRRPGRLVPLLPLAVVLYLALTSTALAASPPLAAITREASEVKRVAATLNGYVIPPEPETLQNATQETETTYYFEYGTNACTVDACGVKSRPSVPTTVEGPTEPQKVTRLKPGTTYHFWLVASSLGGTVHGEEQSFTTTVAEPEEYVFEKDLTVGTPVGVGVNQTTQDVYASDASTHTVEQFNAQGELQSSTKIPGSTSDSIRQLAVDNSGIPGEQGDVYVTDVTGNVVYKFDPNPEGKLELDQTTPEIGKGILNAPFGVAVDPSGNVYVASFGTDSVSEFSSTDALVKENLITGLNAPFALAIDTSGNIFVAGPSGTFEYTSAGVCVNTCASIDPGLEPTGVAVDAAGHVFVSGEVSVADPSAVFEYGPAPTYTRIANPALEGGSVLHTFPYGLAVNNTNHELYVTENESSVRVFKFLSVKPVVVKTEPATQVTGAVEALNATVNPGGQEPAEYYFEYGTAPCNVAAETCGTAVREQSEVPLNGDDPTPVAVRLDDLAPDTTYHYWVVGANEESGVEHGAEQTFTTGSASTPTQAPNEEGGGRIEVPGAKETSPFPVLSGMAPVPGPRASTRHTAAPTRAQKLGKALKLCKHDKAKSKRRGCERTAHGRYGPKSKGKSGAHKGGR